MISDIIFIGKNCDNKISIQQHAVWSHLDHVLWEAKKQCLIRGPGKHPCDIMDGTYVAPPFSTKIGFYPPRIASIKAMRRVDILLLWVG